MVRGGTANSSSRKLSCVGISWDLRRTEREITMERIIHGDVLSPQSWHYALKWTTQGYT